MFKVAESGSKISKKEYEDRLPVLRNELLQAQFALRDAKIPMIIVMAGVEGSGKGEVVNRINSWMDTRGIETHVFKKETDEMRKRPFFWRFWNKGNHFSLSIAKFSLPSAISLNNQNFISEFLQG